MFPLNLIGICLKFIPLNEFTKIIATIFGFVWCSYCNNFFNFLAAVGFLKNIVSEEKKHLVLYPVILFYLFLSFFILMNH